jgi:hypothetical protein
LLVAVFLRDVLDQCGEPIRGIRRDVDVFDQTVQINLAPHAKTLPGLFAAQNLLQVFQWNDRSYLTFVLKGFSLVEKRC